MSSNVAGSMSLKYDDTVEIKFTRFCELADPLTVASLLDMTFFHVLSEHTGIDGPDTLRQDIETSGSSATLDTWITRVGNATFFPSLALFPVLYLDSELCVFEFPFLSSKIAVRKIEPLRLNP